MAILNWLKKGGAFISGGDKKKSEDGRDQWPNRAAFLLASVGGAIGQGNIIRYPSQVFNNVGKSTCYVVAIGTKILKVISCRAPMVYSVPHVHFHSRHSRPDPGGIFWPSVSRWHYRCLQPSQSPNKRRWTGFHFCQRCGCGVLCDHLGKLVVFIYFGKLC